MAVVIKTGKHKGEFCQFSCNLNLSIVENIFFFWNDQESLVYNSYPLDNFSF